MLTDCFTKISFPLDVTPVEWREIFMKLSVGKCKVPSSGAKSSWNSPYTNTNKSTPRISVYKAPHWALYHMRFQNKSELYICLSISIYLSFYSYRHYILSLLFLQFIPCWIIAEGLCFAGICFGCQLMKINIPWCAKT